MLTAKALTAFMSKGKASQWPLSNGAKGCMEHTDSRKPKMTTLQKIAAATLLILWSVVTQAASEMFYVHSDHLGTPQVMTDKDQQVVWERSQTPFGEAVEENGTVIQPLRFPGQYSDAETGLSYNYFRDYDPGLGRYVQSDPVGLGGGLNTYGYTFQNPVRYTDPTGQAVPAVVAACGSNPACLAALGGAAYYAADSIAGMAEAIGDLCERGWNALNESSEEGGAGNSSSDNQRGNPYNGEPGEWVEHPHGKQDRLYGNDGTPAVDIDYGHDHGQGSPHAHNWENGVRGPGVPVSPVK